MKTIVLRFAISLGFISTVLGDPGTYPDHSLTPGDFLNAAHTLPPGSTREVRDVPDSEKTAVFKLYGIPAANQNGTDYEIDHFLPLALGGSNDKKNLWPQTRNKAIEWNAWEKDKLEYKLFELIHAGVVPAAEAQQAILSDWVAAYDKYMPMSVHGTNSFKPAVAPMASIPSEAPKHIHYEPTVPLPQGTADPDGPEKP